jgi:glycosidase
MLANKIEAQTKPLLHVDPPHWYVGMKNANLEILLHGINIGLNQFEISPEGTNAVLDSVQKLPNPNYVILHMNLSKGVKAGDFFIVSKGKAGKFKHLYTLKETTAAKRGLDPSDIIYLITPDRFANGDETNDVVEGMNQTELNRQEPYARHGGDIQGMIDHLDHIQALGMTAVWPNPLLENDQPRESYHGYAFSDYYKIDRRFGSNDLYKAFSDSLHNRGMKLIMDVVYNHIGDRHYLYTDMPDSSWFFMYDSFTKTNYRDNVLYDPYASEYDKKIMTDGWFDTHMPDLDQRNPRLANYLIQQTIWWIETYGIDALRIDTYAYPDQNFMRQWGKEIKNQYPDLFLFAETWVHGTPSQAWFMGDALGPEPNYLDGLTDFQVHYAINDALTKEQGWTDGVARLYYTLSADYVYKEPINMVTFVDNHDLARFYGVVNKDFQKFKMGMTLLITLRGIPSLYYGTEFLMAETDGHGKIREDVMGGWPGDPMDKFTSSGRTDDENQAFELIKELTSLRAAHPALQSGKTTQFVPENGLYVYFRYSDEETFMVVLNTSSKEQKVDFNRVEELVPPGADLNALWGEDRKAEGDLVMEAYGVEIFVVGF